MSTLKNFKIKKTLPLWGVLMVLMVFSCQDLNVDESKMESLSKLDRTASNFVPGRYIVTLHSNEINFRKSDKYEDVQVGMRKIANEMLIRYNIEPEKLKAVYGHALSGFTLELAEDEYRKLSKDPKIKTIELDSYILDDYNVLDNYNILEAYSQRKTPPGKDKPQDGDGGDGGTEPSDPNPSDPGDGGTIQNDAPKYLDRINQRKLPLDNIYSYNSSGMGVNVYIPGFFIVDESGELDGRIINVDIIGDEKNYDEPNRIPTLMALLVGGNTYGPAKNVTLFGLQVFKEQVNSPNFLSEYISGLDWILANGERPGVVILVQLRDIDNPAYFSSLESLYNAGFSLFTNAGAWAEDACKWAGSYSPYVFTVGMARIDDTKQRSSNYGDCIDLFTTATDDGLGPNDYNENGFPSSWVVSSVAAGVAAKFLEQNPTASPNEVYQFLRNTSTKNVVKLSNSINNHLLYSGMTMEGAGEIDPNRINYFMDLEAESTKLKGNNYEVQLRWNPLVLETRWSPEPIDIYENGNFIMGYQDGQKSSFYASVYNLQVSGRNLPPRTYKICLSGTNKCSNEVIVTF